MLDQRVHRAVQAEVEVRIQSDHVYRQERLGAGQATPLIAHHSAIEPGIARLQIRQRKRTPGRSAQDGVILRPLVRERRRAVGRNAQSHALPQFPCLAGGLGDNHRVPHRESGDRAGHGAEAVAYHHTVRPGVTTEHVGQRQR